MTHAVLLGVLLLLPFVEKDERDTVTLNSGKTVKGRVLLETDDRVVLLQGSRRREFRRDKVREVESIAATLGEVLVSYRKTEDSDVEGLLGLARRCDEVGLEYEAALLWWKVLFADPGNAEANEALGNKRSRDEWSTKGPSGRVSVAEVRSLATKKNAPWELRSEHVEIECHGTLEQAVHTLLEVEFQYFYFCLILQRDLEFYEVLEPFQIALFRDRESYPSASNRVGAYFQPSSRTVFTYFAGGRPFALNHECTHAIFHMVNVGDRGARGRLPPWLDEALAEYISGILIPGDGGRLDVDPGRQSKRHLRVIQQTEGQKLYSLHRVLNFNSSDFGASTYQGLKYAQCYQLLHYLLIGAPEQTRDRFMEYFREAMDGKGQASTFRKLLSEEYDDLEKDYLLWGR